MRDTAGIVREALGKEVAKGGVRSVSGGDINDAYLVALEDGQRIFLKINAILIHQ
jgi:fructosamine-3-kinase